MAFFGKYVANRVRNLMLLQLDAAKSDKLLLLLHMTSAMHFI
jgi:hypothetical protein